MEPELPIRLIFSGDLSFGPGKAELLEKIVTLGSLNSAASAMEMSYMKAWKMVKNLNSTFKEPLVELKRGGKEQGGAALTETGKIVLDLHQQSGRSTEKAASSELMHLKQLHALPLLLFPLALQAQSQELRELGEIVVSADSTQPRIRIG